MGTTQFVFFNIFLMGFTAVGLRHFKMNLNENLHQFLSFCQNMVTQIIYLGRMEVGDWYFAVVFRRVACNQPDY